MNSEQKTGKSYRELLVWQKAIVASSEVYKLTKNFPKDEQFALTSQIRRAVVSIAANIAEGYRRDGRKEFAHFLRIAHGSLTELETLITISQEVAYCRAEDCSTIEKQLDEIGRMLYSLRVKL